LGYWHAWTWGDPGNQVNAPYVICGGVGANGTSCAIHLYGNIHDNADGQYPAFELDGLLKSGQTFDASMYSGIRFYFKTGTSDTCLLRRFTVPISTTQPVSLGGACTTNCLDHFGANLGATSGNWVQKTYYFNSTLGSPSLLRQGWGYPVNPMTLSGANLTQLLAVQWIAGRNGSAGTSYVDYWVDEVEFF